MLLQVIVFAVVVGGDFSVVVVVVVVVFDGVDLCNRATKRGPPMWFRRETNGVMG